MQNEFDVSEMVSLNGNYLVQLNLVASSSKPIQLFIMVLHCQVSAYFYFYVLWHAYLGWQLCLYTVQNYETDSYPQSSCQSAEK